MKYFSYCSSAWSVASKFSNVYKRKVVRLESREREATSEGAKIRIPRKKEIIKSFFSALLTTVFLVFPFPPLSNPKKSVV